MKSVYVIFSSDKQNGVILKVSKMIEEEIFIKIYKLSFSIRMKCLEILTLWLPVSFNKYIKTLVKRVVNWYL